MGNSAGSNLNRADLVTESPDTFNGFVRLADSDADEAIEKAANLIATEVHNRLIVLRLLILTLSSVREQYSTAVARFLKDPYNYNVLAGRGRYCACGAPNQWCIVSLSRC